MATEQFANFSESYLNGAIDASQTTLVVDDGSVFPSSGNFRLIIQSEILKATARSSNTITIVRGQEGTTGASHVHGLVVKCVVTAEALNQYLQDNRKYDTVANWPAAGNPGRIYFPSDARLFGIDDGTNWKYFTTISGFKTNLTPPIDSDFSWVNQGGATVSAARDGILLTAPAQASTGLNMRLRYKVKTAPYKVSMHFVPILYGPSGSNFPICGMGFYSSVSGKLINIHLLNSGGAQYVEILKCTNVTTSSSSVLTLLATSLGSKITWFQIEDDNTNIIFRCSYDGQVWLDVFSESRTSFFSGGNPPTGAYFACNAWATTVDAVMHVLHWLEE